MENLSPPSSRLRVWILVIIVFTYALAVIFRLCDLAGRDLWTDEAWVALAALQPTAREALASGQSTPPFYLLTVWATAKVFGGSEAVLRFWSWLFGVALLPLIWLLARSLTARPASWLTLGTVAFSPVMVYYSKELKQYSGDAFFAVLVFYLTERLLARQGDRGWLALSLAGVLGLGFSHPLIFILPVAAAVLWFGLPAPRRLRAALLAAGWVLAFGACYFALFRRDVNPELVAYWAQDFPDFTGLKAFIHWLGQALYRYFRYFLGEWGVLWGPVLLLAGLAVLIRRGRGRAAAYWLGPLLLALSAAALHRYPFMAHYGGNRLMLFSAPLLYLVVATGFVAVFAWLWQQRQRWAALALSGLLLAGLHPLQMVHENLYPSTNREEIQPLVAQLEDHLQPQDLVYVYYYAVSPFRYYYRGPTARLCWGRSCVETGLETTAIMAGAPRRLWLIASHFPDLDYMRKFAANLLGPQWRQQACFTRTGAVLFQFARQGPAVAANPRTPLPTLPESSPAIPPGETAYK